jgi:hypothetical protein
MDSIGNLFISNALLSLQSADILVGISDGLKQKSYKLMSDAFIRAAVNIRQQSGKICIEENRKTSHVIPLANYYICR